jgi:hypothetical protein
MQGPPITAISVHHIVLVLTLVCAKWHKNSTLIYDNEFTEYDLLGGNAEQFVREVQILRSNMPFVTAY